MSGVDWFGVTVTAEVALATPGGPYAQWDQPGWGWDEGLWGPSVQWTDVSSRLRRWSTSRNFRDSGAWSGGTGLMDLLNLDGYLSADNPASPYIVGGLSSMQPWRPVRIRITAGGVTYDIATMLTGPFDDATPSPTPAGGGAAAVSVPLRDEWARLALAGTPGAAAAGAGELFGPRLHRILDAAGHRGPRDIESGTTTMQATTLTTSALRELQLVADSEGGWVWVDASGAIKAIGRRTPIAATRSIAVQATFTDTPSGGTDVGYLTYGKGAAGADVHTSAIFARVGGTAQAYTDTSATALSGALVAQRSDLVCETDAQALTLATWRVALDSTSQTTVTSVSVAPRANGGAWLATYLGLREFDLVQHVRHMPGGYTITRPCWVMGISHDWNVRGKWRITYALADATVPLSYATSLWDVGQWATSPSDPAGCKWFPG